MNEKCLKNKEDVLNFLSKVLDNIENFYTLPNKFFERRKETIVDMKTVLEKLDLPNFPDSSDWGYQIAATGRGIYLNLGNYRSENYISRYNLLSLIGTDLTIDEYAAMHDISSTIVRKHINFGRLPYAYKAGSSWMIPEFSQPIRTEKLPGWFCVNNLREDMIFGNIILKNNNWITIENVKRNNDNKKEFTIQVHSGIYGVESNVEGKIEHILTVENMNKFIIFLLSEPHISYHSNDMGLGAWLYQRD
ncbi:hypothetical protein [Phascolarctobacterium sp.]